MFDALATQAQIAAVINQFGVTATITRQSARIFSGTTVFSSKKIAWDKTDKLSQVSQVSDDSSICYIPGTAKTTPLPGDLVITKTNSYIVMSCEPYMPADVVIAYKLGLQ